MIKQSFKMKSRAVLHTRPIEVFRVVQRHSSMEANASGSESNQDSATNFIYATDTTVAQQSVHHGNINTSSLCHLSNARGRSRPI
jgi:hypothetical protein